MDIHNFGSGASMKDEPGIIDVTDLSLEDLKHLARSHHLKGVLSRLADSPEAPSAGFQAAV